MKKPSVALRVAYCLVLLGVLLPFGLAKTSWMTVARGQSLIDLPYLLAPLLATTVGGYRIYLVARYASTLSSPAVSGFAFFIRFVGILGIYAGVLATLLRWFGSPFMRTFIVSRTDSGLEYFLVGMGLAVVAGAGWAGLLLFELSRLLAFERLARERLATKEDRPAGDLSPARVPTAR